MMEILERIMNIVERVRYMPVMSRAAVWVFAALFVFGVINCLLGYRLLRFWMMLFGFGLGAALGFGIVYTSGVQNSYWYLGVMLALGVLLAILAFAVYRLGIFVLGAGLGMAVSIYILHPTTSSVFFLCILVGVGLGSVAMKRAREVVIVGTSLLGGILAGVSLAKLCSLAEVPYGVAMSAGFALLGMLIQFATNKKSRRKQLRDEEEYRDEEEDWDDEAEEEVTDADAEENF